MSHAVTRNPWRESRNSMTRIMPDSINTFETIRCTAGWWVLKAPNDIQKCTVTLQLNSTNIFPILKNPTYKLASVCAAVPGSGLDGHSLTCDPEQANSPYNGGYYVHVYYMHPSSIQTSFQIQDRIVTNHTTD